MRPIILRANEFQFRRGQLLCNGPVYSRMVLWCKAGAGTIRVNDGIFPFFPGRFLLLPWKHVVRYEPADEAPFLVAGIHVVPDYRGRAVFHVPHHAGDSLAAAPGRRDARGWPSIPGSHGSVRAAGRAVIDGELSEHPPLEPLLEYLVAAFNSAAGVGERRAREMASLLSAELGVALGRFGAARKGFPPALSRMLAHVRSTLPEAHQLAGLAAAGGVSTATANRLFRVALKCSPMAWVLRARMESARELVRTTSLPMGELGRRVGIHDPYYFSRLFKRFWGIPPTRYRKNAQGL